MKLLFHAVRRLGRALKKVFRRVRERVARLEAGHARGMRHDATYRAGVEQASALLNALPGAIGKFFRVLDLANWLAYPTAT